MQVTMKVKDKAIKYPIFSSIAPEYLASEHSAMSGAHTSIQKALYARNP
jgi:hypothetical protein